LLWKVLIVWARLRAASIALIAWWPTAALDTGWVVTHDLDRFIHEAILTHQVLTNPSSAVPVLLTAVRVWVPSIRLVSAVQVMATVDIWSRLWSHTVCIASITDWPLSTICVSFKVAPIEGQIIHSCFGVVISLWTEPVLWSCIFIQAVPECSAVELVRKPSCTQVFAVDMFIIWGAVSWGGRRGLAVHIAIITNRPSSTLSGFWVVAATECQIKHCCLWIVSRLWTSDVLSLGLSLDAVPELPAVVFIRVVSRTILSAVNNLVWW